MAFPATSLLDDFNRADNANLGANWNENIYAGTPTHGVTSNQAKPAATFKSNYWASQFGADQESWATLVALPTSGSGGVARLFVRLQSPGGGESAYHITVVSSGDYYLEKDVAGTITTLQTLGGVGTFQAGWKLGLNVTGSTIKCYQDTGTGWAQVGTDQTDSAVSGAG